MIGKRKRPADFNSRAASIVADATGELSDEPPKDPKAVARGRKGGEVRAARLSPERRREIAVQARASRNGT